MIALLLLTAAPAAANISGAIYTSHGDGTTVNGNNYTAKADVYLNGGPQNTSGPGLPDGTYYFQVTDPSGASKLSSDDISCRQLTVSGGVVSGATGSCPHSNGSFNPANNSLPVQLIPFDTTPNNGCVYKVWATPVGDYSEGSGVFGFIDSKSKTDNFRTCEGTPPPPQATISGIKFYDADLSGTLNAGDVPIPGWQVNASVNSGSLTSASPTCTDAGGAYTFLVSNPGNYTISEVAPPPGFVPTPGAIWLNTTPTSGIVPVNSDGITFGPDFGNVCLGAGGGLTLGFWSNKNGQALIGAADLALLVGLNLRNADGSNFNPANYAAFRTWILNATATNMSYMLSAQLAAMELNVFNGFVTGGSLVFAGTLPAGCTVPGLSGAGFISVTDLMADANAELLADGLTPAGDPERACQEFKKNALDAANNNKNFVQSAATCIASLPVCPYVP